MYLRRLVAKIQSPLPRLQPRPLPPFTAIESSFDEADDERLVDTPVRGRPIERPPVAPGLAAAPVHAPERRPDDSAMPRREIVRDDAQAGRSVAPDADADVPERVVTRTVVTRREREREGGRDDRGPIAADVAEGRVAAPDTTREAAVHARPPVPARADTPAPILRPALPPRTAEREVDTTVVQIAIGRIDVRAATTPAPKAPREEPNRPRVSLEAYLSGKRGDVR